MLHITIQNIKLSRNLAMYTQLMKVYSVKCLAYTLEYEKES